MRNSDVSAGSLPAANKVVSSANNEIPLSISFMIPLMNITNKSGPDETLEVHQILFIPD